MSIVGMARRDVDQRLRVKDLVPNTRREARLTSLRARASSDANARYELLEERVANLEAMSENAAAAQRQSTLTTALAALATYVPTEVITLYLAAAAAQASLGLSDLVLVGAFLVLTPLAVYAATVSANRAAKIERPLIPTAQTWFNMGAATLAFRVWVYALPFADPDKAKGDGAAEAALAVLATSFFLGLLGNIFSFKTPAPQASA